MKLKIMIAVTIFVLLFAGAWWLNEINENRYFVDDQERLINPLTIEEEENIIFRPREYIKIKR